MRRGLFSGTSFFDVRAASLCSMKMRKMPRRAGAAIGGMSAAVQYSICHRVEMLRHP